MLKSQFAKAWDHKVFIWNNVIRISNWFCWCPSSAMLRSLFLHTILFDMKRKNLYSNDVTRRWCILLCYVFNVCESSISYFSVVVRKLVSCEHRKRTATGWKEIHFELRAEAKRLKFYFRLEGFFAFQRNDWFRALINFTMVLSPVSRKK